MINSKLLQKKIQYHTNDKKKSFSKGEAGNWGN